MQLVGISPDSCEATMLVLARRVGQAVRLGDDIWVQVLEIRGGRVRLGILAPRTVVVRREEQLPEPGLKNFRALRATWPDAEACERSELGSGAETRPEFDARANAGTTLADANALIVAEAGSAPVSAGMTLALASRATAREGGTAKERGPDDFLDEGPAGDLWAEIEIALPLEA
ncbi:MAG: carbon storage regulator [Planctomycetaceae bacterium]